MSRIIETDNLAAALDRELCEIEHGKVFIITDTNVGKAVLPMLAEVLKAHNVSIIEFAAGEENKNIHTLCNIWQKLLEDGAARKSLIVNVGGGVVTDMGGFAAATFKRGVKCINIATTLLGAVDAAVGGKTGIDFNGLKNEIGAFSEPESVIISTEPLKTLPYDQLVSGYGEIVKMGMITSSAAYALACNEDILEDMDLLRKGIMMSVREKERIVEMDPKESGLRKVLNLGHTAGHAFETMMLRRQSPVTHGEAVANGLLVTLILSHIILGMSSGEIYRYRDQVLRRYFRPIPLSCKDYDELEELISHDKKNPTAEDIRFVLLESIGNPRIDVPVVSPDLRSALDIYRDLF